MADTLDPTYLPLIDQALARHGWVPRVPKAFLEPYRGESDALRRVNNRCVIALLIVLFDLFWLPQLETAPDIVHLSAVLRFVVLTPFAALFLVLDWQGYLRRSYDPVLLALAIAPCVITAWLCLATEEMLAQPEIYGTPLILLFTGLLLRMRLPMVAVNAAVCSAVYVASIVACPMLSHDQIGTIVFIQVVIAAAAIIFNVQLETRDRRVFLLTQNERIRRALIAQQNQGLLRQTQTDALTSLANRRCFDETLSSAWLDASQMRGSIALIMIDVDHFKAFNDHYGHAGGDDCLRRVAAALAAASRRCDVVARYGGEEFAAILMGTDLKDAADVAERMRAAVETLALPHAGRPAGACVTISVGVAAIRPASHESARKLIEAADRNLYAAKHAGRNRVAVDAGVEPIGSSSVAAIGVNASC